MIMSSGTDDLALEIGPDCSPWEIVSPKEVIVLLRCSLDLLEMLVVDMM